MNLARTDKPREADTTYSISGDNRMGPLRKDRATARAALEEALDLERRGYTRVRIQDDRGHRYDVRRLRTLIASGQLPDA